MLLSSSQDLLYIVLAICIVWFTIFLCWLLYQAARMMRNANEVIETVTHKLELINDAVQFMREKFDGMSKHMGIVSSMVGGMADKLVFSKLSSKLEEKISANDKKTKKKRK
ncbi:MAG: hypothetical protein COU35_02565 [Candidatus Magasanikbacteria bacterium CG10_big_fil_rev_8_21_14_0_10_47_10]|uniref:Uncharacterized protein n=1 Tax=Candidatus Magasanikbacteria bacterium CG10_big_fil_rev_8_21_14_0_10_47_10 TaxID=1974652 RepID=A0A2H0TQJ6_9BACT|nr:MAG: hypothetical protein COU35_02565 [Candidatus Magasanikbacteria bacterium CG10_big_fil_rev_8_21_14_0_10_47_10]